jgi:LysR family transcriptional regulator, carnitine catabolism transcriptional activator
MNLTIRALHAFVVLADCGRFTRAAERCHLSQPAFSQLIHRLEEAVGARLLDRSTRHVALTPEGSLFADAARRIVADAEAAVASLRDHVAGRTGRVAIAALPSIAADWLPEVIAEYRSRHPGVVVELFDVLSDRCLALVREGRADFALAAPNVTLLEFDARPIYTDRYYLVCRRDHPLARRRSVRLADLAAFAIINLSRSSSVRQHLDPVLRDVPHTTTGLEVEQLSTVAALVGNGLGVSLVPELTLFHFRRAGLATVRVDAAGLERPILVVQNKGRSLSMAAAAMLEMIQARAAAKKRDNGVRAKRPKRARAS